MKRKNKIIAGAAISFAAIGTFSIGFASWIVGSVTTPNAQTINVSVADVKDERLEIELGSTGKDLDLGFGPSLITDSTKEGKVVAPSSTTSEEDLYAVIPLTVTTHNGAVARNITFQFTFSSLVKGLIDDGFITTPMADATATTVASIDDKGVLTVAAGNVADGEDYETTTDACWYATVPDNATSPYDLTVYLKFGWGAKFNYANPVKLTAEQWSSANAGDIATVLGNIETALTATDGTDSEPAYIPMILAIAAPEVA